MSSLQLQANPSFSSGSMPVVSGRENPLWKFSLLEGSSSSSNHIYKLYKIGSWSFHLSLLSEMARNFCDFRILLLAAAAAFIFIQVSPSPLLLLRWILLLIWKLRSKLCFLCLFRIPWKIRFFFLNPLGRIVRSVFLRKMIFFGPVSTFFAVFAFQGENVFPNFRGKQIWT